MTMHSSRNLRDRTGVFEEFESGTPTKGMREDRGHSFLSSLFAHLWFLFWLLYQWDLLVIMSAFLAGGVCTLLLSS